MKMTMQFGCVVLLSGILIGCSGSNAAVPAKVSGKITYKGNPVMGGKLSFVTVDGTGYDGIISPDGTYSCNDLPAGELIVCVNTEGLKPSAAVEAAMNTDMGRKRMAVAQKPPPDKAGSAPDNKSLYVKIPAKYANPKTSPLQVTLSRGRNVKDLELTD